MTDAMSLRILIAYRVACAGALDLGSGSLRRSDKRSEIPEKFEDSHWYTH